MLQAVPSKLRARDGRRLGARPGRATTRSRRSSARCALTARRWSRRSPGSPGPRRLDAPGRTRRAAGRGARAGRRRRHGARAAGAVRVTDVARVRRDRRRGRGRCRPRMRRAPTSSLVDPESARRRHGLRRPRRGRTWATRACSAASRAASTRRSPSTTAPPLWGVKGPEPHVAERILERMLDGASTSSSEPPRPATRPSTSTRRYEGDLMARSGARLRGRPRVARPLRRDAGRAGSPRTGPASTTSPCCCRRSPTTARCCRSSASRSSTSAAGRRAARRGRRRPAGATSSASA